MHKLAIAVLILFVVGCARISHESGFKYLLATELQYALDNKAMEDVKGEGYRKFPYKAGEKEK